MEKFLIKYKHIEDTDDYSYIEAMRIDNPTEVIRLLKEVGSINLKDDWYVYNSSEFIPATEIGMIDTIIVYVLSYDDEK